MAWNGRGELVCPLRGQSLESRLAAQASVGRTYRFMKPLMLGGLLLTLLGCGDLGMATIDYRGQEVKLSRRCFDYDDYKNDPSNIHPSEVTRVQAMVREAGVKKRFSTWEDAGHDVLDVAFPGYGSGSMKSEWKSLRVFSIEIPKAEDCRVFVLQPSGSEWVLTDDFLAPKCGMWEVTPEGDTLVFVDLHSKNRFVRPHNRVQ